MGADSCVQKHFDLNIIATALGAPNAKQTYPNERYVARSRAQVLPSHHNTSHHTTPHHTASHHTTPHHITSRCITSHHTIPASEDTREAQEEQELNRSIRNDLIWIMQSGTIVEKRSMHCPGIDDERKDEGDPDLEVEEPQPQPQPSRVGVVSSWLGLLGRVGEVWRAQTRDLQGESES